MPSNNAPPVRQGRRARTPDATEPRRPSDGTNRNLNASPRRRTGRGLLFMTTAEVQTTLAQVAERTGRHAHCEAVGHVIKAALQRGNSDSYVVALLRDALAIAEATEARNRAEADKIARVLSGLTNQ